VKTRKTLLSVWCAIALASAWAVNAQEISAGVNLLKNHTLKECHTLGLPDYWTVPFVLPSMAEQWYGMNVVGLAKDQKPPLPGVNVLRFESHAGFDPNYNYFGIPNYLNKMPKGKYTFSAYMKSDGGSMPVRFSTAFWGGERESFNLDGQWRRYVCTFDFNEDPLVVKLAPEKPGVIFFAAPKLELGGKASAYESGINGEEAKPMDDTKRDDASNTLAIPLTGKAPKLDGRIDAGEWDGATKLDGFKAIDGTNPGNGTEVLLLRSPNSFYLAYKCHDSALDKIKADFQRQYGRDSTAIFSDDVVETFVGDGDAYIHFVTNPNGAQYDAAGVDQGWSCAWSSTAGKQQDGWVAEIEIPLASLPLAFGENGVEMNFCRTRNSGGKPESSAWSARHGGFHNPDDFIRVEGLSATGIDRFGWDIGDVKVVNKKGGALLTATVNHHPKRIEQIMVRVKIGAKGEYRSRKVALSSGSTQLVVAGIVPDLSPGKVVHPVELQICDASDGMVIKNLWLQLPVPSECMPSALLEFNYYTDDEAARLRLHSMPEYVDSVVVEMDGLSIGKPQRIVDNMVSLPLKALPVGRHLARLAFIERGGEKTTLETSIEKLEPVHNEVRVNNWKRCLTLKTCPWLSVYFHTGMKEIEQEWLRRDVLGHGFNTIFLFMYWSDVKELDKEEKKFRKFLDACDSEKLKVVLTVSTYRSWIKSAQDGSFKNLEDVWVGVAKRFGGHPAVLAWNIADEPSKDTWESRGFKVSDLCALHDAVKKADPYHPVYVNWCHTWGKGQQPYGGYACTDIISYDQYPFAVCGRMMRGPQAIDAIAGYTEMVNRPDGNSRPAAFWIQTYGGLYDGGVEPSAEEVKCMVFLNLVAGTRMYGYYAGRPFQKAQWEAQKEANLSAAKMADNIFFPDSSRHMTTTQQGKIKLALWQVGQQYFIVAVNYGYSAATLDYGLGAYFDTTGMAAETWIGEGDPKIKDGCLNDHFAPLQGKVYKVAAPANDGGLFSTLFSWTSQWGIF